MELSQDEAVIRIFFALILGSVIGLEREFSQQPAGLRTHILVCLGSAVFTLISISSLTIGVDINTLTADGPYRIVRDPARIAAQVVSGIGFIGGGAVLRYGANIRGLTTAASLWMASSIGMLAGIGDYRLSTIATLLTFLVLFTIGKLERLMFHKHLKSYNRMRLLATVRSSHLMELQGWIEKTFNHEILELKNSVHHESDTIALTYVVNVKGLKLNINELSKKMSSISGVTTSSIKLYLEEIND